MNFKLVKRLLALVLATLFVYFIATRMVSHGGIFPSLSFILGIFLFVGLFRGLVKVSRKLGASSFHVVRFRGWKSLGLHLFSYCIASYSVILPLRKLFVVRYSDHLVIPGVGLVYGCIFLSVLL